MNLFDAPLDEAAALLLRAQTIYAAFCSGDSTKEAALASLSAVTTQLEMSRAIWMEGFRQDLGRLSVSSERQLLSFCELVKGVDNSKDFGINLLAHVQEEALTSLDQAMELAAREREEVVSLLTNCRILLAVKLALLETAIIKAMLEDETANASLIEELKKRCAVVTIFQSRMSKTMA